MMEEAVRYLINKDRTRGGERVGDGRKEGKEQITGGGREEEDIIENWAMKKKPEGIGWL